MTEQQKQIIVRMSEEGAAIKDIARALDVTESTVKRLRKTTGCKAARRLWTEKEEEQAWALFTDGWSIGQISDALRRPFSTVEARLRKTSKERGVTMYNRKWTDEQREELVWMREQGMSVREIAQEKGITAKSVYDQLAAAGFGKHHRARQSEMAELPPLTDWPKWPGIQCGYCQEFRDAGIAPNCEIRGRCAVLNQEMGRSDFCVADERPKRSGKFPVMYSNRMVWAVEQDRVDSAWRVDKEE